MKLEIGKHYITDCPAVDSVEVFENKSPGKFYANVIQNNFTYCGVLDESSLTFENFSTFAPANITQCKVIGYLE